MQQRQRCHPGSRCGTGCPTFSVPMTTHQVQLVMKQKLLRLPRRPRPAAGCLLTEPMFPTWRLGLSLKSSSTLLPASQSALPAPVTRLRQSSPRRQVGRPAAVLTQMLYKCRSEHSASACMLGPSTSHSMPVGAHPQLKHSYSWDGAGCMLSTHAVPLQLSLSGCDCISAAQVCRLTSTHQADIGDAGSPLSAAAEHPSHAGPESETAGQPAAVTHNSKAAAHQPGPPAAAPGGQPDTDSAAQAEVPSWVQLRAQLSHLFSPAADSSGAAESEWEVLDADLDPVQDPSAASPAAPEPQNQDQPADSHAASRSPPLSLHTYDQAPEKAQASNPELGASCSRASLMYLSLSAHNQGLAEVGISCLYGMHICLMSMLSSFSRLARMQSMHDSQNKALTIALPLQGCRLTPSRTQMKQARGRVCQHLPCSGSSAQKQALTGLASLLQLWRTPFRQSSTALHRLLPTMLMILTLLSLWSSSSLFTAS